MEIRFSLQIKLLALVSLVIILVLTGLMFLTISRQREIHQIAFRDRAGVLAQALDAGIGTRVELEDRNILQSNIYKIIWLNPDIEEISITLPTPEGLKIIASNHTETIGKIADPENFLSYEQGLLLTKTLLQSDGTRLLNVITPVHVGGQRVGTYNIKLSLESEEKAISQQQRQWILTIVISIVIIIVILSILLRKMVITPISEIQKGLKLIGDGNLDWRITPKSKDEIGDLAEGLNKMTEELKKSYTSLEKRVSEKTKELEEAKTVLEIKVEARTKELRQLTESLDEQVKERTKELLEKINELEKFSKLAVGRELKMIELKEEIKKLKEELEKYKK
jgi:methyl-accepting chemotaxis protein